MNQRENSLVDSVHRRGVVVVGGTTVVAVAVVVKRLSLDVLSDHVAELSHRPAGSARPGPAPCPWQLRSQVSSHAGGQVMLQVKRTFDVASQLPTSN